MANLWVQGMVLVMGAATAEGSKVQHLVLVLATRLALMTALRSTVFV